eukprot:403345516
MNQKEKQRFNQVNKSLRIIEKKQIAFQKEEESLTGNDKQAMLAKKLSLQNIGSRFQHKLFSNQLAHKRMTIDNANQHQNIKTQSYLPHQELQPQIIYQQDQKQLLQKQLNKSSQGMQDEKLKNFSKFQEDLQTKFEILKSTSPAPVVGNGQLSQATRAHYTAVNPYKSLQSIISKRKFSVQQFSHNRTTGINMGLSIEKVLENQMEDGSQDERSRMIQFLKNSYQVQNGSKTERHTVEKGRIDEALDRMIINYSVNKEHLNSRNKSSIDTKRQSISNLQSLEHEIREPEEQIVMIQQKRRGSVEQLIRKRKQITKSVQDQIYRQQNHLKSLQNLSAFSMQLPPEQLKDPNSEFRVRRLSMNKSVVGYQRNLINQDNNSPRTSRNLTYQQSQSKNDDKNMISIQDLIIMNSTRALLQDHQKPSLTGTSQIQQPETFQPKIQTTSSYFNKQATSIDGHYFNKQNRTNSSAKNGLKSSFQVRKVSSSSQSLNAWRNTQTGFRQNNQQGNLSNQYIEIQNDSQNQKPLVNITTSNNPYQ